MTTTMAEVKSQFVFGEAPVVPLLRKECNVLCVTKVNTAARRRNFHLPITGKVVIEVFGIQMGDTPVAAETRITFNGKLCKFLYFSTGLNGTCHCIGVEAPEGVDHFDHWRLYTDQMTEKGKQRGSIEAIPSNSNSNWKRLFFE